jgi:hypothetical protein
VPCNEIGGSQGECNRSLHRNGKCRGYGYGCGYGYDRVCSDDVSRLR